MMSDIQDGDRPRLGGARRNSAPDTGGEVRDASNSAIAALDSGGRGSPRKCGSEWTVHQWLKKAVLLSFRLNPMEEISGAPGGASWWDKVPSKFAGWRKSEFEGPASAPFRARSFVAAPISHRARC